MPDAVQLTAAALHMLEWVGKQRHAYAIPHECDPGLWPSRDGASPANHIRGAKCEFAASIILNVYWRPHIGEIGQHDIGGLVEVRSTVLGQGWLIIKSTDKDHKPFVLVIIRDDIFQLAGWLFAREANRFPLITAHGDPAHFVDQEFLGTIDNLRSLLRRFHGGNAGHLNEINDIQTMHVKQ
jgi:hypothetical protein